MPEILKTKAAACVAAFIGGVIVGKWIYEPATETATATVEGGGKKSKKKKHKADN